METMVIQARALTLKARANLWRGEAFDRTSSYDEPLRELMQSTYQIIVKDVRSGPDSVTKVVVLGRYSHPVCHNILYSTQCDYVDFHMKM